VEDLSAATDTKEDPGKKTVLSKKENPELEEKNTSLKMLHSIIELKRNLQQRIRTKKSELKKSRSDTEKVTLSKELEKMDKALIEADNDFERIATGVDIDLFTPQTKEPFNWQNELILLIEPGIMELKQITLRARMKTKLKDEISSLENLSLIGEKASKNIQKLISSTEDAGLKKNLKNLEPEWRGIEEQLQNKLEIIKMQLSKMEAQEKSLVDSTQTAIKNFFKNRGFVMFIAVISGIGIILSLRFFYLLIVKFIPGYTATYRPFHIRALDLLFQAVQIVSVLAVLILVFYSFQDWVLLSLIIIFFLGLTWTIKYTLPKYLHQVRLILNLGAVREGERITLHGVPWLVKNINMFTWIENPSLGVKLRIPIEKLLDQVSRPFDTSEPWFPCKKNEWVILSDGTRGCVTSLSHESVEMVQRGGARKLYQTADFLSLSPLNLSSDFRLKIPFGISYDLQAISTNELLDTLKKFIEQKIELEGYGTSLLNLRVEFSQAGGSSLDIVIISDFKGEMAHLYNRLSRAIQRWCVDACSENNWEIPFPQLTLHKAD